MGCGPSTLALPHTPPVTRRHDWPHRADVPRREAHPPEPHHQNPRDLVLDLHGAGAATRRHLALPDPLPMPRAINLRDLSLDLNPRLDRAASEAPGIPLSRRRLVR